MKTQSLRITAIFLIFLSLTVTSARAQNNDDVANYFDAMSALLRTTISRQVGAGNDANSLVALLSVGISAEPVPRPVTPITEQDLYPYLNMRIFAGTNNAEVNTADLGSTDAVPMEYLKVIADAKISGIPPDKAARVEQIAVRTTALYGAYAAAADALTLKKVELAGRRTRGELSQMDFFTQLGAAQQSFDLNKDVKEYTDIGTEAFSIEAQSPGFIWRLRQRRMSLASQLQFPVVTYPAYNDWSKEDGWYQFAADRKSVTEQISKSNSNVSGSGSYLGFFNLGGSNSNRSEMQSKLSKATAVSFGIKRVFLGRFWLDETVFSDPDFPSKTGKPPLISTGVFNAAGRYGEEDRAAGVSRHEYGLPLIPAEVLLIRNLSISFSDEQSARDFKAGATSGSGGCSIFGFRIGGSGGNSWERTTTTLNQAGNTITASGMSIIGFVCHKVPEFPVATAPKP